MTTSRPDRAPIDALVFGHRLRHHRKGRGLTLAQLGESVGRSAPYLSQLENGRREPKLSLISELAAALAIPTAELLADEPPDERSRLEIALERAQRSPLAADLGLPHLTPTASMSNDVLRHVVGLYDELRHRSGTAGMTDGEARRINVTMRQEMRARDNHFAEIEEVAAEAVSAVGYAGSGALPQRMLTDLATHFGFSTYSSADVPLGARSVTDLRDRRIFIPQRDSLRTRAARSVILKTLGHHALGHEEPADAAEALRQHVEASYFAGAVLVPEEAAVEFLRAAKADRDLSVEDLKEVFYVSYEMAAHRFTNLATHHLGLRVHFVRSNEHGIISKAYENNGVPFPTAPDGSVQGQRLCRRWGTRQAFDSTDKFAIHYQYTDTVEGTYWCATHVEIGENLGQAITIGAGFDDAQWFRGRDTERHSQSGCPDPSCCRVPTGELAARWDGWVRFDAEVRPGPDLPEIYEFVDRHRDD